MCSAYARPGRRRRTGHDSDHPDHLRLGPSPAPLRRLAGVAEVAPEEETLNCRIYYTVVRRKTARRPALKLGKYATSSEDLVDYESVARALERKNKSKHGPVVKTKSNGNKRGWRHYTITFEDGSWIEYRIETHR